MTGPSFPGLSLAALLLAGLAMEPLSVDAKEIEEVRTTAYTHTEADHLEHGRKTASGTILRNDKSYTSAAADWSKYPLGTKFKIKGMDTTFVVDDYGRALVGTETIDLYHPSKSSMNRWGVRHVDIQVVELGDYQRSREILAQRTQFAHVRKMLSSIDQQEKSERKGWALFKPSKKDPAPPAAREQPSPSPKPVPAPSSPSDRLLAGAAPAPTGKAPPATRPAAASPVPAPAPVSGPGSAGPRSASPPPPALAATPPARPSIPLPASGVPAIRTGGRETVASATVAAGAAAPAPAASPTTSSPAAPAISPTPVPLPRKVRPLSLAAVTDGAAATPSLLPPPAPAPVEPRKRSFRPL